MRLKRLEMVGFKSFAQKTTIELTPGITAIVGPNGCGKSNIVDSLRWAMGEQSARHLRGHQMEDVIFSGSESLPAIGMAEVSLTFDNEDGRGPAEYSSFAEIMVTRRLFRSGESEYAINKVPCRLKDIIELFLGTGVGSKAYSIVEQGRVDELVNAKPEDRRTLIEEAAGTSKYKSRKLMAERKLERTQQNLLRVLDIAREIERQIRSMELQAKKAERYRQLKSALKEKDLLHAAIQRRMLTQDIARHEERLTDVENRLTEYLASLGSKEAESESVRLSLLETDKVIGAEQEALYQLKVEIHGQEQKIDFYQSDLLQLGQSETDHQAALVQLERKRTDLGQEIAALQEGKAKLVQLSLFEEGFLRDKETELQGLQRQIEELQATLEQEKQELVEAANQIAYLKNDALTKEKRRSEINQELMRSDEEHAAVTSSLRISEQKQNDGQTAIEELLAKSREKSMDGAQLSALIQSLSAAKEEQERKIAFLKEQIQESRSRLISLEELQKNYEGYQEGVRAIMLKRQCETAPDGIYGLVAEVIDAPEPYEKALTAVLGDRLQYIIVKGHDEGLEAIEYLKREASGRGSFIPLQMSKKMHRELPLGEAEVIAPLLDMISVKPGYCEVAEYLLSDVVVVRDLKSGLAVWNRNGFHSTLVTPEGEVIDPLGIVTGGCGDSLESSFLAQRRRIKELGALLTELASNLQLEERELTSIKERLDQAEARKTLLGQELHRLELERVRLEHENLSAQQELQRLTQAANALTQEKHDLTSALERLTEEIEQCHVNIARGLEERSERETRLAERQRAFADLKNSTEASESAATQSRIRGAALAEKKEHADLDLQNRLKSRDETTEQIESHCAQMTEIRRKRTEIEQSLAQSRARLEQDRTTLQEVESRLKSEREKYKSTSMRLAQIEEAIKELRPLGNACQEEKGQLQLVLAERRIQLQHVADNVREKYDLPLDQLPAEPTETSPEELSAEIDDLRERLERMGDVNLAAIGEYEELTARFQFMNQQREDLEKSIADLQRTIVKLNRICRLRFKETFEQIDEKFQAIFPRLFRGGKARLLLTDESDYLETGVEIVVQPPGKKLQSITLLSGGEKALTAISLLFAIFLTKPSPFCFLDEVDAPLDDANIDRFNELIKEMSQHSQFVLVTHNKKTMQAAEVLYGITMAEPGVSKVVSVRMN